MQLTQEIDPTGKVYYRISGYFQPIDAPGPAMTDQDIVGVLNTLTFGSVRSADSRFDIQVPHPGDRPILRFLPMRDPGEISDLIADLHFMLMRIFGEHDLQCTYGTEQYIRTAHGVTRPLQSAA